MYSALGVSDVGAFPGIAGIGAVSITEQGAYELCLQYMLELDFDDGIVLQVQIEMLSGLAACASCRSWYSRFPLIVQNRVADSLLFCHCLTSLYHCSGGRRFYTDMGCL